MTSGAYPCGHDLRKIKMPLPADESGRKRRNGRQNSRADDASTWLNADVDQNGGDGSQSEEEAVDDASERRQRSDGSVGEFGLKLDEQNAENAINGGCAEKDEEVAERRQKCRHTPMARGQSRDHCDNLF